MNKGVNAALTERIEMVRTVFTPFLLLKRSIGQMPVLQAGAVLLCSKIGPDKLPVQENAMEKGIDGRKGGSRTSGPVKGAVRKYRSGIFPEASQLFRCADAALYEAKRTGKNCSVIRAALSKCESGWHPVYSKRVSVKGRR